MQSIQFMLVTLGLHCAVDSILSLSITSRIEGCRMMSDAVTPENTEDTQPARKAWVVPAVILSDVRTTEAHVTRFTDGTSNGPLAVQYGS